MPRYITFALWILVALMGLGLIWHKANQAYDDRNAQQSVVNLDLEPVDGRAIFDINWNHLPSVDRFRLTDHEGVELDTAKLHGRPYVVSFFFASCQSICRDLNNEIDRVNGLLKDVDVQFLTITVDPERDTQQVLNRYAEGYDAKPSRWAFLRGSQQDLDRIGKRIFDVVVDRDTHTDSIVLVDKWGRYRDRFKWDNPEDMKRFLDVTREVALESQPPIGKPFPTRNVKAGVEPENLSHCHWLRDFHVASENGTPFFSRDYTGSVWLARFGPMNPPLMDQVRNISSEINQRTKQDIRWISLGVTPVSMEEATLNNIRYFQVDSGKLTRIARECFGLNIESQTEPLDPENKNRVSFAGVTSRLFVMDRWCNVRKSIELSDESAVKSLGDLLLELSQEKTPPPPTDGFSSEAATLAPSFPWYSAEEHP